MLPWLRLLTPLVVEGEVDQNVLELPRHLLPRAAAEMSLQVTRVAVGDSRMSRWVSEGYRLWHPPQLQDLTVAWHLLPRLRLLRRLWSLYCLPHYVQRSMALRRS